MVHKFKQNVTVQIKHTFFTFQVLDRNLMESRDELKSKKQV